VSTNNDIEPFSVEYNFQLINSLDKQEQMIKHDVKIHL
jgi:hypothetical protein